MSKCLFCYQETGNDLEYHGKCCKLFFGTTEIPELILNKELLLKLATETVNERIAVTGAQPKLSVSFENKSGGKRLTIVGLWGEYILKPQNEAYSSMPEIEDLTMHLANLHKINTCRHTLIRATNGDLVYLAKRFDRAAGIKIHIEDFCQLAEFQTEQKYHSSYEKCGKLIREYCTNPGLDSLNFFEMLVFSFLTGNNDMHLKNFSLVHGDKEIMLSPAYDLINAQLINPKDKEDMALHLNGRKSKISRNDFVMLSQSLKLQSKAVENIFLKYLNGRERVCEVVQRSFLSPESQNQYVKIWDDKIKRLN